MSYIRNDAGTMIGRFLKMIQLGGSGVAGGRGEEIEIERQTDR